MGANTAENTTLRLKAVLEVLAEGVWSAEKLNAGAVLGEAIERVPLNEYERELLSGGIPRGHKTLTTATARLVKAGWLVKGRSGWSITDDGQRATVAFAEPAAFVAALDAGTPVPAGTPLPAAPAQKPAAKAVRKAAAPAASAEDKKAPSKATKAVGKAAKLIDDAVAPVAKAVRKRKTAAAAQTEPVAEAAAGSAPSGSAVSTETVEQPAAVAVAGDFNIALGAPANWAPQYEESQMELDLVDQLWKLAADVPAGFYTFKIALNRSWDENYGAFGVFDGPNHEVHHGGGPLVIHYDHRTRDIVLG
ncbi:glycosidase [Pseudarthrobacter sp. H2]|uniref:pullulanase X25 domain-containing protein n=1 Tax=Pseudarthrobacter sp. H2 TaxID=3418415 RepID=UPI003CEB35F2